MAEDAWSLQQWLFLVVGCLTIGATNGCYAFFAPFFPPVARPFSPEHESWSRVHRTLLLL